MNPGVRHIRALVNVQMTQAFYWKTVVSPGVNTPVDTTGYTARHAVVNATGVAIINLTSQAGTVVLTPGTGKIESTFSRAAMQVEPGEYTHFLVLTSPGGRDYPLATGRVSIAKGLPV
jgi:hypothetical protein